MRTVKDYTFYTLHNFLPAAVNLVLIPLYLQGITLSDFGVFTLMNTIAQIIALITSLRLSAAALKFMHIKPEDKSWKKLYTSALFWLSIVVGALLTAIAYFMSPLVYILVSKIDRGVFDLLWPFAISYSFFQVVRSFFIGGLFRAERRTAELFIGSCIYAAINLILAAAILLTGALDLVAISWIRLVSIIASCAYMIWVARDLLTPNFKGADLSFIPQTIRYSLGLFPQGLFKFIFDNTDKFFLLAYMTPRDVGIYSILMKIVSVFESIIGSANQTLMPILLKDTGKKLEKNSYRAMGATHVLNSLGYLGLLLFIPFALLFVSSEIVPFWPIIIVLGLACLIQNIQSFQVYQLFASEDTLLVSAISLCMGAISILCNITLVPAFGLWGAAMTYLMTFVSGLLATFVVVRGIKKISLATPTPIILGDFAIVGAGVSGLLLGGVAGYSLFACAFAALVYVGYKYTLLGPTALRTIAFIWNKMGIKQKL